MDGYIKIWYELQAIAAATEEPIDTERLHEAQMTILDGTLLAGRKLAYNTSSDRHVMHEGSLIVGKFDHLELVAAANELLLDLELRDTTIAPTRVELVCLVSLREKKFKAMEFGIGAKTPDHGATTIFASPKADSPYRIRIEIVCESIEIARKTLVDILRGNYKLNCPFAAI